MYKNFYYYILILMILLTSMITLFINKILIIWFILEINNFMFIIFMLMYMKNKKMIFMYFFIQVLSSFLMIISIILSSNEIINHFSEMILMISLMLKMGLPPFHFWLPIISLYMPWDMLLIFFTIQKIIPFNIISMTKFFSSIIFLSIILSMIIPPYMMFNQTNFKKILAYSSINQMGWMLLLILCFPILWLIYLLIYFFTLLFIIYMITKKKIYSNSWLKFYPQSFKLMIILMMMNMSGLPPMSLFLFKWLSIFIYLNSMELNLIIIFMLFNSLIMLFIYVNMFMKVSFMYSLMSKLKFKNFMNKFYLFMKFFIIMTMLISILFIII